MGWDAPWHWVILAIVVIALFGYKKLPDASRALGRSLRIFKAEIKGMSEDDQARAEAKRNANETEPKSIDAPAPTAPRPSPVPPQSSAEATVRAGEKPSAGAE